jgi:hypothetical protein
VQLHDFSVSPLLRLVVLSAISSTVTRKRTWRTMRAWPVVGHHAGAADPVQAERTDGRPVAGVWLIVL